jgi:hypothetical protein
MKALAAALLCSLVIGCATTQPPPTAAPPQSVPPSPSPTSSATLASPSPALITDTWGRISFVRPATWLDQVPTGDAFPGPSFYLSSEALSSGCVPRTPIYPFDCLPGGILPDGGVLIVFGRGATLVRTASTPLPIREVREDACAAAAGRELVTGFETFYIDGCVRGSAAEAAFRAFVQSLGLTP